MLPLTPTKLGRYEILDEIGKGAMGVVYLARDPLIGRLVALKTFRMGFSVRDQEAEQFRARFIREAQSAGILSHPNIVTIHDVVESSGEGLSFIAMEYVRGTNLKMVLQGEPSLPIGRVADIVSQVAEALDYAHSQRVIHRDVKPANIIITEEGRVKITDFGIARLDTSNLTQEGQLLGTPNYMAPEQVQGKEVDHRADIFALGVVLYEMLTRHKPFQGENLTVVSHRIVYDQFTPLREYARDVPAGVEKVISKALEKEPARRYQRARELAEDLKRLAAEAQTDALNETQSLSSTMVIPPDRLPGASTTSSPTVTPGSGSDRSVGSVGSSAAPARPSLWGRLFGGGAPAAAPVTAAPVTAAPPPPPAPVPTPAAAPDILSGSGSQSSLPLPPPVPFPAPAPPVSPVSDDGSGTSASSAPGMPSATGSSLSVPPPPPVPMPSQVPSQVASQAAAPVSRPVPPASAGRSRGTTWVIAAVLAAIVLGALVVWGIARMRTPEPAPPVVAATPTPATVDVAKLVAQGNVLMRKGEFAAAAEAYRSAELHARNDPEIIRLRQGAEKLQVDFDGMVGREQEVEAKLAEARAALRLRRYPEALAAAQFVVDTRPTEDEARGILKRAQAEARLRATQKASEQAPQATPASEGIPADLPSDTETTAPAEPQTGRLSMSLRIDAPAAEGTIRVLLKGARELWKQEFDVGTGLLKRRRGRDFSKGVDVPAGETELSIIYSPRDLKESGAQKPLRLEVAGGSTRRVDIRITESKKLYAITD